MCTVLYFTLLYCGVMWAPHLNDQEWTMWSKGCQRVSEDVNVLSQTAGLTHVTPQLRQEARHDGLWRGSRWDGDTLISAEQSYQVSQAIVPNIFSFDSSYF